MTLEDDALSALQAKAESLQVDYKLKVEWTSLHARIELARDIVCLANRSGGLLILGVRDDGAGRWDPVGLQAADVLPDPTELGKVLSKYFDPVPTYVVREFHDGAARFGVVQVDEFARTPIVCKVIGNDENNVAVVRPGDFFRRTDAMQCSKVNTAAGIQAIVDAAAVKTGSIVGRMLGGPHQPPSAPRSEEGPPSVPPSEDSSETLRICDLVPVEGVLEASLTELERRTADATVIAAGGYFIPRSINLRSIEPTAIVREPGRLLVERTQDESQRAVTSVLEVRPGAVRVREGLWEDADKLDVDALLGWVAGCLVFAARFYKGTAVRRISIQIGASNALGRQLVSNPARFWPFMHTYAATSSVPLVVTREVSMDELVDGATRLGVARAIHVELCALFGFAPEEQVLDSHLDYVKSFVQGVAEDV